MPSLEHFMPEAEQGLPQKPALSSDETVSEAEARISGSFVSRLGPAVLVATLLAIAIAFWAINGPSVFAQIAASAWALCF
jgi:hypothetical protein